MASAMQRTDETLRQRKTQAGATGVVCFLTENALITANLGDSRAILVHAARAVMDPPYDPDTRAPYADAITSADRISHTVSASNILADTAPPGENE